MRHSEIAQIVEPLDRAFESAAWSEGAYVELVDDGARKRAGLPVRVSPRECRVIDQARWTVNAIGLEWRTRIRYRIAAIDNEAVIGTGACAFHAARPPATVHGLHGM